ncbi:PaaI family thioesterase [Marinobacter salicampi]|uniref:PaaI family thioesterase n=1 Tax=Marinobacter salicampi TaxID=435907 RepID=UPI00140CF757|nr:PaaI family thioesterase [Marinobacter salicampi]
MVAIQDLYDEKFSHCYGCGKRNPQGNQLKSYIVDGHTVARFRPKPEQTGGVPEHAYGGLIASLFDCHGAASAAAFEYEATTGHLENNSRLKRYVTASLKVEFLRPTPMGQEITIKGKCRRIDGRKVWVDMEISVKDEVCAVAEMLAIQLK